ncbi:hypothetical protein [Streptomyces sp. NPDC002602]
MSQAVKEFSIERRPAALRGLRECPGVLQSSYGRWGETCGGAEAPRAQE